MKTLFQKNPLYFALVWIGIYVVGMSVLDNMPGIPNAAAALGGVSASVFLLIWLKKNGLYDQFGLCKGCLSALWLLPLAVLTCRNLWGGFTVHYPVAETVFFIIKMLCVGFLEELIFRGFLFRAMEKDSLKWAIIVSSLTFGFGHIVNLINGSGMTLMENLTQIVSAVIIGFLYVVIFYRGKSLLPCILSHGIFNSLSAFAGERSAGTEYILSLVLCVLAAGYAYALWKTKKLPLHKGAVSEADGGIPAA